MTNELKYQEGQAPLDEHIRPIKVGDKATSLETAQSGDGVKVNGDLEITGSVPVLNCDSYEKKNDFNFRQKSPGTGQYNFGYGSTTNAIIGANEGGSGGSVKLNAELNSSDYCKLKTTTNGATTLETVDADAASASLTLDIDGLVDINSGTSRSIELDSGSSIALDSHTGAFIARKAGTEFSVENSAYAGMILGYTTVGIDAVDDSYVLTTTMACLDDAMKVKFKAPPSGVVEIFAQIYFDASRRSPVLGLSDANATTGYSAIDFPNANDVTNEHLQATPPSSAGDSVLRPHWVVTGLTAGDIYEWWFAAKTQAGLGGALKWGGSLTNKFPPFIMKATALPTAVADYAVYG